MLMLFPSALLGDVLRCLRRSSRMKQANNADPNPRRKNHEHVIDGPLRRRRRVQTPR